jgi:hypothetical protein
MCIYVYVCVYMYMYVCVYVCVYVCTYVHTKAIQRNDIYAVLHGEADEAKAMLREELFLGVGGLYLLPNTTRVLYKDGCMYVCV